MRHALMLAASCFALAACGTDAGPEPNVTVKSATPDELVVSNDLLDDVTITVEYDDGDGDLGEGLALVHDCRGDGLVTELVLPAIAPDDVVADGTHITGTLEPPRQRRGPDRARSTADRVCRPRRRGPRRGSDGVLRRAQGRGRPRRRRRLRDGDLAVE